jgi:hypothetical protein
MRCARHGTAATGDVMRRLVARTPPEGRPRERVRVGKHVYIVIRTLDADLRSFDDHL